MLKNENPIAVIKICSNFLLYTFRKNVEKTGKKNWHRVLGSWND